ncbi:MAG: DegV family EDD domain-containing protein [Eubacterium sp.]|nr:DegV family EDD domain-containing protein [Eubacterium sp.]
MKFVRMLGNFLKDPERDFTERKFVMMTIIAMVGEFLALIGDIIFQDSWIEIVVMIGALFGVPAITALSVWKKRADLGSLIVAIGFTFGILPVIFYFGGGICGGGVIWVIFGYMYVGVVVSGVIRWILISVVTVETVVAFVVSYFFPKAIVFHNNVMTLIDVGISVIVVGFLVYTMVWFLNRMLEFERDRAREEARRAEEATRTQNQFFSSMSHEIRTPINTVLGLNEIILRQEDASDEIRKDARNIQGAGKMLLALINDILDVSKIEAGKMDIVPVSYDVGELVSEIVNMIWLKAEEKGLEFRVDIDPSIPTTLYGDEIRVKQILINLLNNAVKYTAEGTVTLHMECERDSVENVILKATVSDTGMGIRSEVMPHLFDTFRRVDEERNRHIEGTGLGLSIVKQLVELMDGEISVDSVYGQGSSFAVTLLQKIEDETAIGNLQITGDGYFGKTEGLVHMFHAPKARVLIVDDNEMNLEVEKKLLDGTEMTVDLSSSGAEALKQTLRFSYDVIFLDHLMPEMDGVECFREIRRQVGGLNTTTPIIVLTANAGGENQELYNVTGFDAYVMKPVSGKQLEDMLLRFLPEEKVHRTADSEMTKGHINTAGGYAKKLPVVITTSSICDLPEDIKRELQIPTIPFVLYTNHGEFWDGEEMVSDELIRYMSVEGNTVSTDIPSKKQYMEFFSSELRRAHHVIHITLTPSMSDEYERATLAANIFENVTVVNSEGLSSSTGLLVLVAYRLVQKGYSVQRILEELEVAKKRIHCSFVLAGTDYMTRAGHISSKLNTLFKTLWIRPSVRIKKDTFGVDRLMVGSIHRCYERYIKRALPARGNPDKDLLFVTYVDVSEEDIVWIEEKIRKRVDFNHIVFQKASSAISANCGPGTFGLLYIDEGKTNYNLGSFIPEEVDEDEIPDLYTWEERKAGEKADISTNAETGVNADTGTNIDIRGDVGASVKEPESIYHSLPGIDADAALKSCGSEESLKNVCQLFYDSIDSKEQELRSFYEKEDWANYTIKIHALKSSARLIGALALSQDAEALEMAGKRDDIEYIRENHERVMADYNAYREILVPVVLVKDVGQSEDDSLPLIDPETLADVYDRIRTMAEDCDDLGISDALTGLNDYRLPDGEKHRIELVRQAIDNFDFDAVLDAMNETIGE